MPPYFWCVTAKDNDKIERRRRKSLNVISRCDAGSRHYKASNVRPRYSILVVPDDEGLSFVALRQTRIRSVRSRILGCWRLEEAHSCLSMGDSFTEGFMKGVKSWSTKEFACNAKDLVEGKGAGSCGLVEYSHYYK